MNRFFEYFFKRPPVVFPVISVFLLIICMYDIVQWVGFDRVMKIYWLRPLPVVLYTSFWIAATFFKKWGAVAFVILAILHLAAVIFLKENEMVGRLLDNFMVNPVPLGLIFSLIILIYFRKIR